MPTCKCGSNSFEEGEFAPVCRGCGIVQEQLTFIDTSAEYNIYQQSEIAEKEHYVLRHNTGDAFVDAINANCEIVRKLPKRLRKTATVEVPKNDSCGHLPSVPSVVPAQQKHSTNERATEASPALETSTTLAQSAAQRYKTCFAMISKISEALGLPSRVQTNATILFTKVATSLPAKANVRSLNPLLVASLYTEAKELQISRTIKEFIQCAKQCGIKDVAQKSFSGAQKKIQVFKSSAETTVEHSLGSAPSLQSPKQGASNAVEEAKDVASNLARRVCLDLQFSAQIAEQAASKALMISTIYLGLKPGTLAAATVFVVSNEKSSSEHSMEEIAELCGVSSRSVMRLMKKLENAK